MRISTNTLFDTGLARMSDLQSSIVRTQEQIATGRRLLAPSDDPVAAAQALEITQARAINEQYAVNRSGARHTLNIQEQTLNSVTSLLQDVQTMVVTAGNGAYDDMQRQFMATELRGRLQDLLGLANADDGAGNYLFSGFQSSTKPFVTSGDGVQYAGDQGQRTLQVGNQRSIPLSETGNLIFEGIKTGTGRFEVGAAPENTGSGTINPLSGKTPSSSFEIRFTGENEYDVIDVGVDPEEVVTHGNAFASGQMISVDGANIEIGGAPADGDVFTVAPSRNQSVFSTIEDLINVLSTPAQGDAGKAALANGLAAAGRNLGNALDNVLTVRAAAGARLRELDSLDDHGTVRDIQYAATLAELQEVDYNKALTELTKQSIILQAAQQSFVKTSSLSLFNFM